jgi:hemerythrin
VFLKGHPTIAVHRAVHAEFIDKARNFEKAFEEKKEEINGDLFTYLVKWIREHILETDCLFFQEQAKKNSACINHQPKLTTPSINIFLNSAI